MRTCPIEYCFKAVYLVYEKARVDHISRFDEKDNLMRTMAEWLSRGPVDRATPAVVLAIKICQENHHTYEIDICGRIAKGLQSLREEAGPIFDKVLLRYKISWLIPSALKSSSFPSKIWNLNWTGSVSDYRDPSKRFVFISYCISKSRITRSF